MTFYYLHDESGCTLMSDDPPSVVCCEPCVELITRDMYERACTKYGEPVLPHPDPCPETRLRIRVAVAAWAYEMHDDPIMSDAEFDQLARSIDTDRSTARSDLDAWFTANFSPDTGIWVRSHPEPAGLERIYRMLRGAVQISTAGAALHIWMVAP